MSKNSIAIMSQGHSFVIPENINCLAGVPAVTIKMAVKIDVRGALNNKKWRFLGALVFIRGAPELTVTRWRSSF
jgi:hypothetical protein